MTELTKRIISVLKKVPKGKVATYGQVAKLAGSSGCARQVVWTLHSSSSKHRLPWHRVLNSQGKIGLSEENGYLKQKARLVREGVEFDRFGRVDLVRYGWKPARRSFGAWKPSRSGQ